MHLKLKQATSHFLLALALITPIGACSDSPTEPVAPTTTFVTISVSCDVLVTHESGQWRVNYCTNALGGGVTAGALIVPGSFNSERQATLRRFGACMNRRTAIEQRVCYEML